MEYFLNQCRRAHPGGMLSMVQDLTVMEIELMTETRHHIDALKKTEVLLKNHYNSVTK